MIEVKDFDTIKRQLGKIGAGVNTRQRALLDLLMLVNPSGITEAKAYIEKGDREEIESLASLDTSEKQEKFIDSYFAGDKYLFAGEGIPHLSHRQFYEELGKNEAYGKEMQTYFLHNIIYDMPGTYREENEDQDEPILITNLGNIKNKEGQQIMTRKDILFYVDEILKIDFFITNFAEIEQLLFNTTRVQKQKFFDNYCSKEKAKKLIGIITNKNNGKVIMGHLITILTMGYEPEFQETFDKFLEVAEIEKIIIDTIKDAKEKYEIDFLYELLDEELPTAPFPKLFWENLSNTLQKSILYKTLDGVIKELLEAKVQSVQN